MQSHSQKPVTNIVKKLNLSKENSLERAAVKSEA